MSALHVAVALVLVQRLAELIHARRNTRRLMENGGIEHDARYYWLYVLVHASWFAALLLFVEPATEPDYFALAIYVLLQPVRYWVVATLGPYWTTRVIVVPGRAAIRNGPYRLIRHPNYVVVVCEIALLPLAFGAWLVALIFTILNAALVLRRIRIENQLFARHA